MLLNRPLVTVCVATFNQVDYIADCVNSVLAQHGPFCLEVLVGDDGSTDGTRAVLRELAAAHTQVLTVLEREENLGPAGNYQDMVRRARGDFVAHVDGDDFWLPSKLRRQLALLQEHPQAVAVYCNAYAIGRDNAPRGLFNQAQPATFDASYLLERGNFLNHSSMLYRREAMSCVTEIEGPFIDYMVHLRLANVGRLAYVNAALVGYRVEVAASLTGSAPRTVHELYWNVIKAAARRSELSRATRGCLARFVADRIVEGVIWRQPRPAMAWFARVATLDRSIRAGLWPLVLAWMAKRLISFVVSRASRRSRAGSVLFSR